MISCSEEFIKSIKNPMIKLPFFQLFQISVEVSGDEIKRYAKFKCPNGDIVDFEVDNEKINELLMSI
jgi:hypothetical protein